ncbi:hypothetical protein ACI2LC_42195 [Nonomuraea wenchangensis]|uniref:hypothetical protein n=1 Tax=Nonomuraea wenchangensis TaxID=568860 RepID=UPI003404885F
MILTVTTPTMRIDRASPALARSINALSILVFTRDSRADTAWSNSITTSSTGSIADCVTTAG